uniref:BPTI/Kunitz inhibitor domain-containing protein n=1 Tax=Syphacia muris TaxID=451379 RepID=A0A0N5AKG9_9BILA
MDNSINMLMLFELLFLSYSRHIYAEEADECLSLLCTPPKICKLVDQIVQCVSADTTDTPTITAIESFVTSTSPLPYKVKKRNGPPPKFCNLEPVTGHCSKNYILWYYNFEEHSCERFSYSGCGNNNRFLTKAECEWTCM